MNFFSEKDFLNLDNYVLLDVRSVEEFAESHLKHAQNIPVDSLVETKAFSFDKEIPIICYCRSGMRSQKASEYLSLLGYKAHNIGGMMSFSEDFLSQMLEQ